MQLLNIINQIVYEDFRVYIVYGFRLLPLLWLLAKRLDLTGSRIRLIIQHLIQRLPILIFEIGMLLA